VHQLIAFCLNDACRHQALIDVSSYPSDTPVPWFRSKFKCAKCGARGQRIDVRPNWKEQLGMPDSWQMAYRAIACEKIVQPGKGERSGGSLSPYAVPIARCCLGVRSGPISPPPDPAIVESAFGRNFDPAGTDAEFAGCLSVRPIPIPQAPRALAG
jgi:hypothetical protein